MMPTFRPLQSAVCTLPTPFRPSRRGLPSNFSSPSFLLRFHLRSPTAGGAQARSLHHQRMAPPLYTMILPTIIRPGGAALCTCTPAFFNIHSTTTPATLFTAPTPAALRPHSPLPWTSPPFPFTIQRSCNPQRQPSGVSSPSLIFRRPSFSHPCDLFGWQTLTDR